MGGNAIKKVPVSRIRKDVYDAILRDLTSILSSLNIKFGFPREMPGKESFGDVDVLVETSQGIGQSKTDVIHLIEEQFQPEEIVASGPVISFAYAREGLYHQVDFILIPNLLMSHFYFSYGDFGAIVGRYCSYHGLTFSESGLLLKVKLNYLPCKKGTDLDNVIGTIVLSDSPREICEYLRLDYEKWYAGFTHPHEIFEWITQSRFYAKDIYSFLAMEHRKRAHLRPFYIQFLEYIQINASEINNIENKRTNEMLLESVFASLEHFNKLAELNEMNEKSILFETRKAKFNSTIFIDNGIELRQLGETMKKFKSEMEGRNFEAWLDENDLETIQVEIKNWIKSYLSQQVER